MDPETAALLQALAAQQGGGAGMPPGEPTLDPAADPMVANGMAPGAMPDPAMADPAQGPPPMPGGPGDMAMDPPGQMAASIGQMLAAQADQARSMIDQQLMAEIQRLSELMAASATGPQTFDGPMAPGVPY